MKSDLLQDAIGEVREDYVLDAETAVGEKRDAETVTGNKRDADVTEGKIRDADTIAGKERNTEAVVEKKRNADAGAGKKRYGWMKWGAAAAFLCLIGMGAGLALSDKGGNHVLQWDASFAAEQYFKYSDGEEMVSSNGMSDSVIPYAESRYFSDQREKLENEDVLPQMPNHLMSAFRADYNADGSLYSLVLAWHRRDREGTENYSDLIVTAGYEEVPSIEDCIAIEIDENGNVLGPAVTVTERDGIPIIAKGGEGRDKTLTFQTENGWYQITGSWNDNYNDVVALLDWFWDHPIDFTLFPMEKGDHYTYCGYSEVPDAFAEYLPAFTDFGYFCQEANLTLKNGVPVYFEGHYLSNVTAEQAESGEYTIGENGCYSIHWCLDTEPDAYDLENCIGRLGELQKEQVLNLLPPDSVTTETRIRFMQGDSVVTIYASDVGEAWKLMESLR